MRISKGPFQTEGLYGLLSIASGSIAVFRFKLGDLVGASLALVCCLVVVALFVRNAITDEKPSNVLLEVSLALGAALICIAFWWVITLAM